MYPPVTISYTEFFGTHGVTCTLALAEHKGEGFYTVVEVGQLVLKYRKTSKDKLKLKMHYRSGYARFIHVFSKLGVREKLTAKGITELAFTGMRNNDLLDELVYKTGIYSNQFTAKFYLGLLPISAVGDYDQKAIINTPIRY